MLGFFVLLIPGGSRVASPPSLPAGNHFAQSCLFARPLGLATELGASGGKLQRKADRQRRPCQQAVFLRRQTDSLRREADPASQNHLHQDDGVPGHANRVTQFLHGERSCDRAQQHSQGRACRAQGLADYLAERREQDGYQISPRQALSIFMISSFCGGEAPALPRRRLARRAACRRAFLKRT